MTDTEFYALPAWDGGGVKDAHDIVYWDMRQDPATRTVYYRTHETPRKVNVWCAGSQLAAHLHHLEQIRAR